MVARVASFEGVDFAEAEKTLDQAEAIGRPLIGALAGYQGNYELAAANGKVLSITLFDTPENAEAAERTFDEELPRQLGHLFTGWAGRRVSVDLYNVVSRANAGSSRVPGRLGDLVAQREDPDLVHLVGDRVVQRVRPDVAPEPVEPDERGRRARAGDLEDARVDLEAVRVARIFAAETTTATSPRLRSVSASRSCIASCTSEIARSTSASVARRSVGELAVGREHVGVVDRLLGFDCSGGRVFVRVYSTAVSSAPCAIPR